ncbi:hypothetical protein EPN83_02890 [Patescibacteria group bacterium]|nr:MAG: hypothetical protein EPN83_02890 [Patescibacteria group bacterium]
MVSAKKATVFILIATVLIWFMLQIIDGEKKNISYPLEKTFESPEFKFSFRYPTNYSLEEKKVAADSILRVIVLKEDATENRKLARESQGKETKLGEKPFSITIEIHEPRAGINSLEAWVRDEKRPNFRANVKNIKPTAVGVPALSYSWSGLYETDAVVTIHRGKIIATQVTYKSKNDQIRKDFKRILESFRFQ